jgi:hypothetical protein
MTNQFDTRLDSVWFARLLTFLLALIVLAGTLTSSILRAGGIGFPVDDAWIFQTFARNVALHGEIAFNPNVPVTGASSFLWLWLLVPGHLLPIEQVVWTHILTALGYIVLGWSILALAPLFIKDTRARRWALLAAALTLLEWHLVWSAFSGMETLLFVILSLWLIYFVLRDSPAWLVGLIGGALTLTRIEGAVLFALAWLWTLRKPTWQERVVPLAIFAIVIAPMLAVNWMIGGSLLPNTWSAKLSGLQQPRAGLQFLLEYSVMILLGVNVLLLPAFLFLLKATRAEKKIFLLPLAWCMSLLLTYVVTFPIIYHHMRYMMPTLPWLILLGVAGIARLFRENRAVGLLQIALSSLFAVGVALFGMNVYGWNVQNTNAQHVTVGKWLRQNTPPGAQVAADDIGAIGYFSERYVVDLAGLITPEVIPILRANLPIAPFLCAHKVDYLAVFPHTHPELSRDFQVQELYRAHLDLNTITPHQDMLVLHLNNCTPP